MDCLPWHRCRRYLLSHKATRHPVSGLTRAYDKKFLFSCYFVISVLDDYSAHNPINWWYHSGILHTFHGCGRTNTLNCAVVISKPHYRLKLPYDTLWRCQYCHGYGSDIVIVTSASQHRMEHQERFNLREAIRWIGWQGSKSLFKPKVCVYIHFY